MNKKHIIWLSVLSLLLGAGLAGGLYVVGTPTKVFPKAVSLPADSQPSGPTNILEPTPAEVAEQEIIAGFGGYSPRLDLNQDGIVNSLDLQQFRQASWVVRLPEAK